MAVIEYRIEVNGGIVKVTQDVRRIGPGDTLIFTTTGANVSPGKTMAIKYQTASPFTSAGHPLADVPFLVTTAPVQPIDNLPASDKHPVQQASETNGIIFGGRTTFHFDCGEATPGNPPTGFNKWPGGSGGNSGDIGN